MKVWTLMDQDNINLTRETIAVCTSKTKKACICYYPFTGHFPSTSCSASVCVMDVWESNTITKNFLPSSSFPWAFITERNIIWHNISLWSICVSNPIYIPSKILPINSLLGGEKESTDAVQVLFSNFWTISTFLARNPKCSNIALLWRKFTPSQPDSAH